MSNPNELAYSNELTLLLSLGLSALQAAHYFSTPEEERTPEQEAKMRESLREINRVKETRILEKLENIINQEQ